MIVDVIKGHRLFEVQVPAHDHTPTHPSYDLRPHTAKVWLEAEHWSVTITDRAGVIVASTGGERTKHDPHRRRVNEAVADYLLTREINKFRALKAALA